LYIYVSLNPTTNHLFLENPVRAVRCGLTVPQQSAFLQASEPFQELLREQESVMQARAELSLPSCIESTTEFSQINLIEVFLFLEFTTPLYGNF
jgi:hypothetical protein